MTETDAYDAISRVVDRAYEVLAFEPGESPQWGNFSTLFVDGALLALRVFPQDPHISVLDLTTYATAQMRNDLQSEGYSETPGQRDVTIVGSVASVRQDFTMNFAGSAPVFATDIFSLVYVDQGWRIVSVVSDTTDHEA